MKLIGILGELGSGKDEAARALTEEVGAVVFSFALPIKQLLQEVSGWPLVYLWGDSDRRNDVDPEWGVSPRDALIKIGEAGRAIHPDFWVRPLMRRVAALAGSDSVVVVSDVRRLNEVQAIRDAGGKVIKIVRPGKPKTRYSSDSTESDQSLIPDAFIDTIIVNDGTISDLRRAVLDFESKMSHSS